MPPSRRFLPALLAVSALLFSGGASSAHAMEGDPPDTAVEVGPDGVGVRTPGALVEIDPGSYVLVCANGVRVKVGVGEAPPCDSSPEPPPVPPPPQEPPPVEPAPEEPPVEPVPEEPAPQEPVPGEPERRAPTEVEAEPEPVHVAPVLVSEERAPAPVEPSAPPPVPTVTEEVVREQLLADTSTSSAQRPTGAFTPMRTMVVLVVVVAVVAAGAGRAAARPAG